MIRSWQAPALRYLCAQDVERLLPPISEQLTLVRNTFAASAGGLALTPPAVSLRPTPTGFIDALPAYAGDRKVSTVKWVGGDERNAEFGAPYISGLTIVSDGDTGMPIAILDGAAITAARTAAVSGVTISALAPERWSVVALIGLGKQGLSHLKVVQALNPDAQIRVVTRQLRVSEEANVECVSNSREAIEGADVVITGIPLSARLEPQVEPEWLKPGSLVLPLDDDSSLSAGVVNDAGLFVVDDEERYERDRECGLFEDWRSADGSVGELLDQPHTVPGFTVCMNQGMGLMDAAFADEVRLAAEVHSVGQLLVR